ncbi:hypothetical protein M885DRAFT_570517 [Pelagophyceae sp. CCMP2097]|nr:hypothetical protein M885DRAFT_570517 [Pelagophyceae sp. CCMP2097]
MDVPRAPPAVDQSFVGTRIEYAEKTSFANNTSAIYWIAGDFDAQPSLGEAADSDETTEESPLHAKINGQGKSC